jgi:ParB family chromosome partitioning protein
MKISIDDIEVGERSRAELRNIESLAHSIREHSLIQPPVVRRDGGRYVLVCGGRRLAAMRSLGWTQTPVVVAESITDELAALYAEGDENTEREPFTVAEAVAHAKRIREAEARAAKERQRAAGPASVAKRERREDGSAKLAEPSEPEPRHERETRHRTAKATGFGHATLKKAERVLEVADDEAQPEPVRKIARQAAENLNHHGAKVDREYKTVQEAVVEHSDHAQAYRDAQWRKELLKEIGRIGDIKTFDPERVVAVCDDDQLYLIDSVCEAVAEWHSEIARLRQPGLRAVPGGSR